MHDSLTYPVRKGNGLLTAAARFADAVRGSHGCFFTFHRVARSADWAGLPNRDYYLDLDFLDRLLGHLSASGRRVVTVEEGLRLARDPRTRGTFINFSIDDCYRDVYELMMPLFRRHNAPLTLYVATGIPDGTIPLWWIGLEDTILERDFVLASGERIETDTTERKMAAYRKLQWAWDGTAAPRHYEYFCRENDVDADAVHWKHALTWDMLAELARDPLVEIGSHTVTHPRVSLLTSEEAERELGGSRARLAEKLDVPVDYFAFPYGRVKDCGPRDFEIARASGYKGVGVTTKGLLTPGKVPFAFPRVTLNGAHQNLVVPELHIAGVSAIAARMLGRV